jgi:CRISPR-associated protein Csx3
MVIDSGINSTIKKYHPMSYSAVKSLKRERTMTIYSLQLVDDTLKVDFAKNEEDQPISAESDCLVRDMQFQVRQMIASGEVAGGNLLKIHGPILVAVCYTLAHELAHLYRAIAVSDTRLGAYVVVSSTTSEYPIGCRIDFKSGEVTEVKSSTKVSECSFFLRKEGDILRVQINNSVSVDGDQIVRDAEDQLQQLITSKQLSGGQLLKINGRATALASFVIAVKLASYYRVIAVFDPKVGTPELDRYIVSISHTQDYQVGDTIDVECKQYHSMKVVLCGFPNTGKTIFRDGLKEAIFKLKDAPADVYVISGCPDGDGCWYSETAQKNPELAQQLKADYKRKFTPEFAVAKAKEIAVNKNSLLVFDVGGKISPENQLIMSKATHAVIVAKSALEVAEWQVFCQEINLPVIAIVYSDIEATTDEIQSESPVFMGTVHQLKRGQPVGNRPLIQALAKKLVELAKSGSGE